MKEHGDHRLLHFARVGHRRALLLDFAGLAEFRLKEGNPFRSAALHAVHGSRFGQIADRFGDCGHARRAKQDGGPHQRAFIPGLRIPQRRRQGAQDAARALEALDLGPAAVEDIRQVRVEREAVQKALLGILARPPGGLVEPGDPLHDADHMRPEGGPVADAVGLEKAAGQHLGHVLLLHGLDPLLALAAEHVGEVAQDPSAQRIVLPVGLGRQQRGDDGRPVDLRHGLRQVLEEIAQVRRPVPAAPPRGNGRTS